MHIQECRDESKIYKNQQIQLLNNTLITEILEGGGYTRPDLIVTCTCTMAVSQNMTKTSKLTNLTIFMTLL